MNNYEYIIASLPALQQDDKAAAGLDVDGVIAEIREQLSGRDLKSLDLLLAGYDPEQLNADFYRRAAASNEPFLREYFMYDLVVRNAKVAYLNRELGRPAGTDVLSLEEASEDEPMEIHELSAEEQEALDEIVAVLERKDLIERERGLDDLMWAKVEQLTGMHLFDMEVILGFVARMKVIDRWLKLDPETGRELFRKLVEEIRKTK